MSDDAQEKNHKAERENNNSNKQQQAKTGQGNLVGTGKGRRGRQGTWWGTWEGTTPLAGFRCAVAETPAGCLPPRPPNPGATIRDCHRNSKHIWCLHMYPQREFKSPWWKSGWNLGSCRVWGCAEIRVYAMACWRRRRRRRILSSLTLLTHSLSANVFRAGISPPTCWKFSSMLAFAIWLRAPFSR